MEKLTIEKLKEMSPGRFAQGTIQNGPGEDQIYMTNTGIGRELKFVARRGQIHDWAVYVGWSDEMSFARVETNGQKVYIAEYIKRMVDCDESAMKMYRP